MTPLEIYTIAGGDWLRGNLNAIAAFMGTATWSSIEKMCIAFSVLIVAVSWVKKHNIMDLVGWVFSLTLVSMLVVVADCVWNLTTYSLIDAPRSPKLSYRFAAKKGS